MKKNPTPPTHADLKKLHTRIERLAEHFDRKEMQNYLELLGKPRRLLWVNFLAGLSRGVGMMLGGGIVGTLVIGILVGVGAYFIHTLGGLPWIGEKLKELIATVTSIVQDSAQ